MFDEPNPSKNPDYPLLVESRKTFPEVVAYYTMMSRHEPLCGALADLTSWLANQPYSNQLRAYGALGNTLLFLIDDQLLEGPMASYCADEETARYYVRFSGPWGTSLRRSWGTSCTEKFLRQEMEKALNRLLGEDPRHGT